MLPPPSYCRYHLSQADKVAIRRKRVVTCRNRREKCRLVHGRLDRKVGRRLLERQRLDAQVGSRKACELIDCGAARGEICHHLRRYLGRIGGDTPSRHTVRPREHQHLDVIEARRTSPLPLRKPRDEILETSKAASRLRELGLVIGHGRGSSSIARWQVEAGRPEFGDRGKSSLRFAHRGSYPRPS